MEGNEILETSIVQSAKVGGGWRKKVTTKLTMPSKSTKISNELINGARKMQVKFKLNSNSVFSFIVKQWNFSLNEYSFDFATIDY
jgi:hypothetical protein